MRPTRRHAAAVGLAVLAAAVLLSGCGSERAGVSGAGSAPDRPDDLAGITMVDVASGDEVLLTDALDAPASTPVLAAFWAPH